MNNGESFKYLKCNRCGTLSLLDATVDVSKYYGADYYSHSIMKSQKKIPTFIKVLLQIIIEYKIAIPIFLRMPLSYKYGGNILKLYKSGIKREDNILDVGAGNGAWAARMCDFGYNNICCIDQYVKESPYPNVEFICGEFENFYEERKYDLVTLHHSFEHMRDPDLVLKKIRAILKTNGLCIIRIPLCDSIAWEKYHENWYQIDAPRHYYLYTRKAMSLLCTRNGLRVDRVVYDSYYAQFANSMLLEKQDISFKAAGEIGIRYQWKYYLKSWWANTTKRGDQAAFYISLAD
jgi:SAM-dependent methyltransferase